MEKLNSFDQLLNYPIENGLSYETHIDEKRFYISTNDPLLNTKYITFKQQDITFCAYDSYAAKSGTTRTFTGIYSSIRLRPEMEMELSRKHWTDYFLVFNKRRIGVGLIDKNFTISAAKNWNFQSVLSEKDALLFLELEKQIKPLKLVIQHNYIPIITELKGQHVIGLETNQWLSQKENVDYFFNHGAKLINNLIKSSRQFF